MQSSRFLSAIARRVLPAAAILAGLSLGARASADEIQYYHLDAVGNVRLVTDQAGNVVERHDYLPFGEEWCPGPPSGMCVGATPGQPKRFTGKERDGETGLHYFGARYYRSDLGRFTTVDRHFSIANALVNPQRWNRYEYALSNPLRIVDPDGNDPRGALATLGEKLAEYNLRAQGYTIVLSAGRKAYNQGGFDTVATRESETLAIDNKAYLSRRTASTATSLAENIEQNVRRAIGELQGRLQSEALSASERAMMEQAIDALESGSFQRVVTGAGGIVTRVGAKLASNGVLFKALGRIGGAAAFVAMEGYFAEGVGGFESDVVLTSEEQGLYNRYKAGEDIFGQGDRTPH